MSWSRLNLRHLAAVGQIVALGRIGAAARACNLSQPAVTQALASVEALLRQPLFERRPNGMRSLPAAAMLAPRIAAALAQIDCRHATMAQLRALIAVADAGSYAAAAATTGLSQPSLHRAVSNLALVLKRPLVERRGRGIVLTASGRQTVRRFRLARAELRAGLSELASLAGRETGRITVGAMPLARAWLLPAAVVAFHRCHPHVDVRIVEGSHAELIEPLRDGEIDLLIGALRDPSPGADVEQSPLFVDRPVVIARAGHPLAGGSAASLSMLASYEWIVAAPGTPLRDLWQRMFDATGIATPAAPIECGSVITIRQILLDTDLLTLLSPDQVAVELAAGCLTTICDAPADSSRTIGTTTRAGWRPTPLQAAFLAGIRATERT